MSVRKRILPSGEIRWLCDYRDGGGKRAASSSRPKKATKFSQETGVAVRAGTHVADAASVTVKRASELWLDRCRLDGLEAGTLRNYKEHLDLHILPLIGDVELSRLTKPVVEGFRTSSWKRTRRLRREVDGLSQEFGFRSPGARSGCSERGDRR